MISRLKMHHRKLAAVFMAVCLLAFGTLDLLHETHHILDGDIVECSVCTQAPTADDALASEQYTVLAVSPKTSTTSESYQKTSSHKHFYYTSRAPPVLAI